MRNSLQRRLLYSYIMVVVLVLACVSAGISLLLREYFLASKEKELVDKGLEFGRLVESYNEGRIDQAQFVKLIDSVDAFLDARVWVIDASRRVVAISTPPASGMGRGMGLGQGGLGMGRGHMGQGGHGMGQGNVLARTLADRLEPVFGGQVLTRNFYHPIYGENMLIVGVPLFKADGTVNGAVVLNSPVRGVDEFLRRIYLYIGGLGLAALLLTFFLVRRLASGITRPLRDMQEAAATMARGDYAIRVKADDGDEVGELGRSLNALAQELGRFVAGTARMEKLRRDFVANISHELRTPLTVIRGYTEALLDGTVQEPQEAEKYHHVMRDETVRLEGLINELLDLSRLQAEGAVLAMEKIPLAAIADSVVSLLMPRAEQAGVALTLETDGETGVNGNGDRLTQLLLILLDNALKFTPPGGRVTASIVRAGDEVRLQVVDTGSGIAREDLPFIWERFYKGDKSHGRTGAGTGLGLAIAREIVARHGARAEVASELGRGSTFTVFFPAA
ncbi:sensor histidine kinase [Anaeroselena agilis]|uniref:histidine kinase n=1 Tax=Anaeroselena agilis TaxID=3063788 RepID=A0ABU3NYP2_9FIRM|nr:ATP-binding protein [Selenomonadales bacterium 4137-cl]